MHTEYQLFYQISTLTIKQLLSNMFDHQNGVRLKHDNMHSGMLTV